MKKIQAHIADQQLGFALHPLFARLRRNDPLREVLPFLSHLSFWVMAFQDVLRLNESRFHDPTLKKIARHHRSEDAGHDKWFLADLLKIEGQNPDMRALFSSQHAATRDATYALVSEVYRAGSDYERIVLLLSLESTGHIFFEAIAAYFERMGVTQSLQYFSRHHIDVEKSHEVFEHQMHAFLDTIVLPEGENASCCALVDRAYQAFTLMFDHFENLCRKQASQPFPSETVAERLLSHEAHIRAA